ncbi:MAG: RagB/SusD family nutrient uptake outer membrane protein [Prevotellaceae bacterium]|nr:RagB/SusD family nutrient uptake outer membrane protein [Prevotellaceae bacterium]
MNNKIRTIFRLGMLAGFFLLFVGLSSCKDYLNIDKYFSKELKIDSIFTQKRWVEAYIWGAATMFPDEGQLFSSPYTPGPLATDEVFSLLSTDTYRGISFTLGEVTPSNMGTLDIWGTMYKIIRKCNTIFARIDEAPDITASERLRMLGYTRFIRAYAYYNLLMNFGPPILLDAEIVENNEPMEYYDRPRATYDEAVEYICSELEEAARFLLLRVPLAEFGRPTKGAAYGLIARLRLIHASPLYNGGKDARMYFGSWKRKTDGAYYVAQVYDEKRWAVAAAAAKRVIDMDMYALHTVSADITTPELPENTSDDPNYHNDYPDGANGIDPFKSHYEMFTGEAIYSTNPEYVWARLSVATKTATKDSHPASNRTGNNGLAVTQKVIDAFRMIDGRTIYSSSDKYPYLETGFSSGNQLKGFSGYQFTPAEDVHNMYINREARFYTSIGFSGCYWPCESTSVSGSYNMTVTYYANSPNGQQSVAVANVPPTGYVLKKYVNSFDSWEGTIGKVLDKPYPIIRYAEILLSYAEALNNLTGNHNVTVGEESQTFTRDLNEIKKAFNLVRYRAGLPGLSQSELNSQATIQAAIEQERMVEFLCENRRYFDVRRWGKYEQTESEPIMGMDVEAPKDYFYRKVIPNTSRIGSRVVNKRLIFVPIPKSDIRRMTLLDQNPGWENY